MPLTAKGEKILGNMEETYGSEKKAKSVLYASKNAGKIGGIDQLGSVVEGAASLGGRVGATAGASGLSGFSGSTGGSVGGTMNTMINPVRSASTQSQSQENEAMGRPASAGAFGATPTSPVTGDLNRGRKMADVEGPKGVLKPMGQLEEKPITTTSAGGPSGTPDWSAGGKSAAKAWGAAKGMGNKEELERLNPKKDAAGQRDNDPIKLPGTMPEEGAIKVSPAGSPSGVPDKAGRRQLASDRPPDKRIGTARDYAAAAGAKR